METFIRCNGVTDLKDLVPKLDPMYRANWVAMRESQSAQSMSRWRKKIRRHAS
jgi:hypothetical protein